MIPFFIYLLVFYLLIRYSRLFNLFDDREINRKTFALVFLLKLMAVPAVYILYAYFYGGIEKFDSGVFFRDSKELNSLAWRHPIEYLKALTGFQDDRPGSFFFKEYISRSSNWDNGRLRILFYNDNRVLIRLHSLIHFAAFNSYFVHSLFSCLFSYIGLVKIYKCLKINFQGKELSVLLILCVSPGLWLHTGALLKEGFAVFIMGGLMWELKWVWSKHYHRLFYLFIYVIFSFLLKPYLLLFSGLCFGALFYLEQTNLKFKLFFFLGFLLGGLLLFDVYSRVQTQKSLYRIASARQRVFSDAAKGGIFLQDSVKFIRLNYDSTLIVAVKSKPGYFRIRKNAPYVYWEHSHQQDTLFCKANKDSLSIYQEAYRMPESRSNLYVPKRTDAQAESVFRSLYHALLYPLFFNAYSALHMLASAENCVILIALMISLLGLVFSNRSRLPAFVFICFALCECVLIAFTSPNAGAIFRYRAPVVIFIYLSAFYYWEDVLGVFKGKAKQN